MAKTAKQVQTDIYRLIKDSTLYTKISGDVYRNGYRPRDSRLEDAVVIFTAGLPEQIQTGIVTINIYVPDIDPYENGVFVEDGERVEQVERYAQEWVDSLTAEVSSYLFKLQQTIYTMEEPTINQHFVVVKLGYKYFGNDDNDYLNIPQESLVLVTENDEMIIMQPTSRQ
jgi:hypothetical protein